MTERDRKLAGVASLLVTISVAANMIAFQDKGQGSIIETGGLGARTAWVDGPGLNLGSAVTVPVAAQPPVPIAQGPSNDVGNISSAEITRGIQRELNSRGYEAGQPDGVAGLVTRAAIFAYEYDNDLVLTGKPSDPLLSQIFMASTYPLEIVQADRYPDVRRRSVFELAERCNYWPEHSQHVARLAIGLFDQTRAIHGLTDREREWLEYAAILHDIGVLISYEGHHKHSYYLVKNGDLRGFEPDEIEAIALVARYHRQGTPKRKHDGFADLRRRTRRTVRTLAAILRLAESLDRSHAQTISGLELHDRGHDDLLQLRTTGDAELELWAATRHGAPFERLTGKPLRIEVSGHAYAEQPDATTRVPGQTVRGRGHRRLGQDDAARAAGEVAERRGSPRVRHRMELVRAREGGDQDRQKEKRAHPDDVQPAARHGLR